MRGIHLGEFQGLAPIGKLVGDKAIDMFHVSGGKIVEHWRDGDDPTDFLHQPGVPDLPRLRPCVARWGRWSLGFPRAEC